MRPTAGLSCTQHQTILCSILFVFTRNQKSDGSGDWNTASSVSKLLEVFANFSEEFRALLEKADPKTLKVWNLLDMDVIPTWSNGRLALIGDAAHPFLPHQVRILSDKDPSAPPVRPRVSRSSCKASPVTRIHICTLLTATNRAKAAVWLSRMLWRWAWFSNAA